MPWSIFSDGGGPSAALTWAIDLLKAINAPLTPGNEQFVFDWEVSEGGGGKYNPLNQGPVPGEPQLTSTGPQYGGGAADFVSWQAGLQGAEDYLSMSSFQPIMADLQSNNPGAARTALWDSPWASSHYGYGSMWSNESIPGHGSALPITPTGPGSVGPGSTSGGPTGSGSAPTTITGAVSSIGDDLKNIAIIGPVVLAGGALIVWGFVRMTGNKQKQGGSGAARAAELGALA